MARSDTKIDSAPSVREPGPGDALVIVDMQNDFMPGGALGVPHADEIIPLLRSCAGVFARRGLPVYATRDWHPANHCSFRAQGGPWPPHCIADTPGAQFAPGLDLPASTAVISKATQAEQEAYSGFEGTDLERRLRAAGVRRLFVGGVATDYCVLATVRDARRLGFDVVLLEDAVRAVNVAPNDEQKALGAMRELGVQTVRSAELAAA